MFRIANLVMVLALLVTAAVVYQVKYASTADAERLAHLRQAIRAERDSIAVMRAEWARRTSPLYVQGLVQRHLDLQVLSVDAMSTLDDLPDRTAPKGDGIGGMIEALSDAPLTTSSISKPERATTSSSSSASSSSTSANSGGAAVLPATSALRPASAPIAAPKPPSVPTASLSGQRPVAATRASGPALVSEPPSIPTPPPASSSPVDGLVRGIGSFFGPVVPSSGH